ncbi:hypothetical protein [Caloranaerobacter ferrireducens]|uniref:hypothetical protein n=1 Tax=Caloranaerobacter ferrireducens TaxID=1323370 RepID=UPI00159F1AB6|nr:hypothetical protein [Caloranaerobacter ferrireducens]
MILGITNIFIKKAGLLYFNHLPLDDCNFGTNNSLLEKIGLQLIEKSHEEDGF